MVSQENYSGWHERFEAELSRGNSARAAGNEGQARVCARRAAGHALGEYFRRQGWPDPGPSAYDRLAALQDHAHLAAQITAEARLLAERLLMRVDAQYSLPPEIDLLADARRLASLLLE